MVSYYVVDAFTDTLFGGNPAGVCVLEQPLDGGTMQKIAAENNLAETAFVSKREDGYDLRWFTPKVEMDLCGHATLASAFVVASFYDKDAQTMDFHTLSGILSVRRSGDLYEMDFPARPPERADVTPLMEKAVGVSVLEAHRARDLLLLVDGESRVREMNPDFSLIEQIPDCFAVVVTSKGKDCDFVSRFFAPAAGVPEDPVTGSSHSTLIPFWAARLGKEEMTAKQLSERGGTLFCRSCGDRVKIAGKAILYLKGEIRTV